MSGSPGQQKRCSPMARWKRGTPCAFSLTKPAGRFQKIVTTSLLAKGRVFSFSEEEERAKARGADILARLSGFGMNADGKDMINPSMDGGRGMYGDGAVGRPYQ